MTDGPQVPRAEKVPGVGTETWDQLCDLSQTYLLGLSALMCQRGVGSASEDSGHGGRLDRVGNTGTYSLSVLGLSFLNREILSSQ